MKYQKPKVVAKSAAKQTFAAGCPTNIPSTNCNPANQRCMAGSLK